MAVLFVRRLRKDYGGRRVVDDLDFSVRAGETFGFLGPNSAGKSTTIKMLCTLVRPSGGTGQVAGCDIVADRDGVRRAIGLVFQETTLDKYLTAEQNLRLHARLYGVPRRQVDQRVAESLAVMGLADAARRKVRTLSGGMCRRLEIARGLLHHPRVLFLDEPTVGLDPQARAGLWDHVAELKRRREITVFLTTHYLDEAEGCDRIAIMNAGRLVALDTPDALKATVGRDRVRLRTSDNIGVIKTLRGDFGIAGDVQAGRVVFEVANGARFLPRLFARLNSPITEVTVAGPSLEDVFLARVGHSIRAVDPLGPSVEAAHL